MTASDHPTWSELLRSATTEPGLLSAAYAAFHEYSLGNQLLAYAQCRARAIAPGPIATFPKWKERGRHVRRGETALTLCIPVTLRRTADGEDEPDETRTVFVYKPRWFVLSQTDGEPYVASPIPEWDRARALGRLGIREVPFEATSGNVQGYAQPAERTIAVSPVAAMPHKTTFHELGHVLLHADAQVSDGETLPRSLKEAEAECVALLCLDALGLDGADLCRGYVQAWWGRQPIPEPSARRIIAAAGRILGAGRPTEGSTPDAERHRQHRSRADRSRPVRRLRAADLGRLAPTRRSGTPRDPGCPAPDRQHLRLQASRQVARRHPSAD